MTTEESCEYQMVLVEWADAHASEGGWLQLDGVEDDGECLVTTIGFLILAGEPGGKEGHVSLWQTVCDGEGIHGFWIPNGMVRRIQFLNPFSASLQV